MPLPPSYQGPVVRDFLLTLEHAQNELGDIFLMPFGKSTLTLICNADLAYEVLVTQNRHFVKLGADGQKPGLQRVLGKGILTNPEFESWFSHRQLIQPFFQRHQLERFSESILRASERFIKNWQIGENVNLSQAMLELTLELMFELVFSLSPSEAKNYPISVPLSLASAKNSFVKRYTENLDTVVYSLIQQRKDALLRGETFTDLLDALLSAKDAQTQEGLSDQELRDELLTVFAAGHETTANALIWALIALAEQPQVLANLQAELANFESKAALDALKQAPFKLGTYLQAVFKETLRLYPAIPFAPRIAVKTTQLAGFELAKGSKVFVSIYSIHRNKNLWDDAHVFKPERFLTKATQSAYMPFGLGERVCMGQHLATLEGQIILASLLNHLSFKILNLKDIVPKVSISLQPKEDLMAELSFR